MQEEKFGILLEGEFSSVIFTVYYKIEKDTFDESRKKRSVWIYFIQT
ncbi:hypothetical protein LEP1GSC016_2761 [Leptospira borgpetersenii serovar Hardjo-bovis str. Sponselee]|uniref:Uncharacterized protein n=7 Tax=Leptospira borgpetersenii TaxID=174 RepID=M3HUS8_LEPBO|nr:hypothetical protein [Leptospira borgpetersenii]ALO25003.1 hypothetical protein LBBP_00665 [Leptospira borgpetersenii serovar Ballum]EKQ91309.1 hypothetical protein LEP1GSC101_1554 [Leptospira borgpetersenii str. UI 09149]EKR02109.1 hypothetical protein LEP1GSC121_0947 [Leptospira borgpetersenii serovar Castellonis str. 200801910]EMG01340.1 hypothetical protein LEP1GSC123_3802 [Leptospira borgpetersenii str. 200701203]EMJ78671.1 hypothetical protein LEP1GSC016_2761 [Leptospira borgpeterseni